MTAIATIGATGTQAVVIPPNGYLLLENCKFAADSQAATTQPSSGPADANAAVYRPVDSGILPTLGSGGPWTGPPVQIPAATQPSSPPYGSLYQDVYVPYLENVIPTTATASGGTSPGGELVLLRPRLANGQYSTYTDPANTAGYAAGSESFDENPATNSTGYLADLVPVDSFDFTNVPAPAAAIYSVWNYVRAKGNDKNGNFLFRTTYPGTYDAFYVPSRQKATTAQKYTPSVAPTTQPWTSTTQPSTQPSPVFGQSSPGSVPFAGNSLPPPVQVYNVGTVGTDGSGYPYSSHFPNPVAKFDTATRTTVALTTTNTHPLGGFARNGDMLDIPFIGAYRIRALSTPTDTALSASYSLSSDSAIGISVSPNFLELNSLPMDCSYAAVNDATAPYQDIGRFVRTAAHAPGYAGTDYYFWARNLFNYLTVQSSTDAYLPNFDPNLLSSNYTGTPTFAYPPQNSTSPPPAPPAIPPTPALTADATATDQTKQDNIGVEGLVNINTASWKVLSMLPLVPGNVPETEALAKAIVAYRMANGPFTSIFDLNQVPGFQTAEGTISVTAPTSALGLLSPADLGFGTASPNSIAPLQGEEDYQGDCLELTRISNLITTRSDTFTVYVELQGWQNAGSTNASLPPQPMITRRYAFIVDRSAINGDPNSRFLKTVTVPND
jgi:hypothetical protein